jgi:hypothetical protein
MYFVLVLVVCVRPFGSSRSQGSVRSALGFFSGVQADATSTDTISAKRQLRLLLILPLKNPNMVKKLVENSRFTAKLESARRVLNATKSWPGFGLVI